MLGTIAFLSCAGAIAHANPATLSIHADGVRMTHLYHNAATGETIATRTGEPRGSGPALVWKSLAGNPCPGQPGPGAIVADDPDDIDGFGLIHMDWGDIAPDTIVSTVQFSVATEYPDVDADGDGFPDGVLGLGLRLAFFSGENGAGGGGGGASVEVGSVTVMDLPGQLDPSGFEAYQLTVDLAGIGTSLGVPLGSTDVDGDGLADFGYSFEYLHPPTDDQPPRKTYLILGAPEGQAVPDGQGGWTIMPDPAPNAQGTTDAIDVYWRDVFGEPEYVKTIGGQFSCAPNAGGYYAQIALALFASEGTDCRADLFPPGAPDGQLNFFDVSAYLAAYSAGCP